MESSSAGIRLLVVDDHALFRQGLRSLLNMQPDLDVVGEATGGREAISRTDELRPDVVIMDLAMPDLNGMEATRLIKEAHPEVEVLALSVHGTDDYVLRALESGASGYVLKEAEANELASAVRAVHGGGAFVCPALARRLIDQHVIGRNPSGSRSGTNGLTPRELQILKLLGNGLTNEEMAGELGLSVNTVQTHRAHVMSKLGLHNRAQLVRYAAQAGLLDVASTQVLPTE